MSSNTVTSISVVPIFLTRPFLFLGMKPTIVSTITTFLQEFLRVSVRESQTLKLRPAILPSLPEIVAFCNADTIALIKACFGDVPAVDSASVASANLAVPIPLALACHFFGLTWDDWFMALGGSEFKLVLKPRCIYVVKQSDGCIGVVWTDLNLSAGVIHPSVTASMHPISSSLSSPVDNPDSEDTCTSTSRPSSRSSNYSNLSFSRSSTSSQSSVGSFNAAFKPKPSYTLSFPVKTPTQAIFTRITTCPTLTPITNTHRISPTGPVKAVPTKYLYEGGMSMVLTGGVMLGNQTAPARARASTKAGPSSSCRTASVAA
ncbi:hypothetical protein C0995_010896 [Termitomyces sp. Mi166|nr:hypothetical protein C0995_010896 [Termitomyces sp. Mi166\